MEEKETDKIQCLRKKISKGEKVPMVSMMWQQTSWIKSGQDLQVIWGNVSVPRWVIARSDLPKQPETKPRKWDFLLSSLLTSAVSSERK